MADHIPSRYSELSPSYLPSHFRVSARDEEPFSPSQPLSFSAQNHPPSSPPNCGYLGNNKFVSYEMHTPPPKQNFLSVLSASEVTPQSSASLSSRDSASSYSTCSSFEANDSFDSSRSGSIHTEAFMGRWAAVNPGHRRNDSPLSSLSNSLAVMGVASTSAPHSPSSFSHFSPSLQFSPYLNHDSNPGSQSADSGTPPLSHQLESQNSTLQQSNPSESTTCIMGKHQTGSCKQSGVSRSCSDLPTISPSCLETPIISTSPTPSPSYSLCIQTSPRPPNVSPRRNLFQSLQAPGSSPDNRSNNTAGTLTVSAHPPRPQIYRSLSSVPQDEFEDDMEIVDNFDRHESRGTQTTEALGSPSFRPPPLSRSRSDNSSIRSRSHSVQELANSRISSFYDEPGNDDSLLSSPTAKRKSPGNLLARTSAQFLSNPRGSPSRTRRESTYKPKARPTPQTVEVATKVAGVCSGLPSKLREPPPQSPSRPIPKLPYFHKTGSPNHWIDCNTLVAMMRGEYSHLIQNYHIIDCRSEEEFHGGHIKNALRMDVPSLVEKFLTGADKPSNTKNTAGAKPSVALIFHCEFSERRSPNVLNDFRAADRDFNQHIYPDVSYPDVYILDGGYQKFFETFRELCEPQGYVKENIKHQKHVTHKTAARALFSKSTSSIQSLSNFGTDFEGSHRFSFDFADQLNAKDKDASASTSGNKS